MSRLPGGRPTGAPLPPTTVDQDLFAAANAESEAARKREDAHTRRYGDRPHIAFETERPPACGRVPNPDDDEDPPTTPHAWPWLSMMLCGFIGMTEHDYQGRTAQRKNNCGVLGCPKCTANSRGKTTGAVERLKLPHAAAWYLITHSDVDSPCTSYAQRDRFLGNLRRWQRSAARDDKKGCMFYAGVNVLETVAKDSPSGEVCPLLAYRGETPRERAARKGAFFPDTLEAMLWDAEAMRLASLHHEHGPSCPVCQGNGRLPAVHLHAHCIVAAQPFWYGSRSPQVTRDEAHDAGREFAIKARRAWADGDLKRAKDLAKAAKSSYDKAKRCQYAIDTRMSTPPDGGLWSWADRYGLGHVDAQPLASQQHATNYLRKVCSYLGDRKKLENGDGPPLDAWMLGAWMSGKRSAWTWGGFLGYRAVTRDMRVKRIVPGTDKDAAKSPEGSKLAASIEGVPYVTTLYSPAQRTYQPPPKAAKWPNAVRTGARTAQGITHAWLGYLAPVLFVGRADDTRATVQTGTRCLRVPWSRVYAGPPPLPPRAKAAERRPGLRRSAPRGGADLAHQSKSIGSAIWEDSELSPLPPWVPSGHVVRTFGKVEHANDPAPGLHTLGRYCLLSWRKLQAQHNRIARKVRRDQRNEGDLWPYVRDNWDGDVYAALIDKLLSTLQATPYLTDFRAEHLQNLPDHGKGTTPETETRSVWWLTEWTDNAALSMDEKEMLRGKLPKDKPTYLCSYSTLTNLREHLRAFRNHSTL